jgi:HJR/Mrr/RecB family endonuclease
MLNGSGDVGPSEFDIHDVAPPDVPEFHSPVLQIAEILALKPRHFEAYVALLWQRRGFRQVILGPGSGDGGVDVVAINGTDGELIQCKTSQSTDKALGWEAIKEVVGGEAAYLRRYPGVSFTRVCVSNVVFNSTATLQADHNRVRLVDRRLLEELQAGHPITLEDVEKVLHPTWNS